MISVAAVESSTATPSLSVDMLRSWLGCATGIVRALVGLDAVPWPGCTAAGLIPTTVPSLATSSHSVPVPSKVPPATPGGKRRVADRGQRDRVELAYHPLHRVDDERRVAVQGERDAQARGGLGGRGDLQGGQVEGADLPGGEVAQHQVAVGLADLDHVPLRVDDLEPGVDAAGLGVDPGDLAPVGGVEPGAGVGRGQGVVLGAYPEYRRAQGDQEADNDAEGDQTTSAARESPQSSHAQPY